MLFVHETHQVIGRHAHEFESVYRSEWMPAVALDDGARLLWYADHAHLTCFAYYVLTITALRDGNAWERLAHRIHGGDLREMARTLDGMRHDVEAQVLRPAPWSTLTDLDLGSVPSVETEHDSVLYVEDTFRTRDQIDETLARNLEVGATDGSDGSLAETVGCFFAAHAETGADDVVLWQRVRQPELLLPSLMKRSEIRADTHNGGRVVSDGIERLDSTLQRVARWSPLA